MAHTIIAPFSGKKTGFDVKKKKENFAVQKPHVLGGYTFIILCSVNSLCYEEPGFYSYSCMMYVLGVNSWYFKEVVTLPV